MTKRKQIKPLAMGDHPIQWHPVDGEYQPKGNEWVNVMFSTGHMDCKIGASMAFLSDIIYWSYPIPPNPGRKAKLMEERR